MFLGFRDGRPVQWLLHWKTAKLLCNGISEKLARSKDKMDFRPFQFMGHSNDESLRWRANYILDMISVLDWSRSNTEMDGIGGPYLNQIISLQTIQPNGTRK
jgi:hypothetical protein